VFGSVYVVSAGYDVSSAEAPLLFGYIDTLDSLTVLLNKGGDTLVWNDPHSGISTVEVKVLRAADNQILSNSVFAWVQVLMHSNATVYFPRQADGTQLSIKVTVANMAGVTAMQSAIGVLDGSLPVLTNTPIKDCMRDSSLDIDHEVYVDLLFACIDADTFVDSISGVLRLESVLQYYDLGQWLNINSICTHANSTSRIVYSHSQDACRLSMPLTCGGKLVCLLPQNKFRFKVRTVNHAGTASAWAYTDSIMLDNTIPSAGRVYHLQMSTDRFDGRVISHASIGLQSSTAKVSVAWEPFTDKESDLMFYAWETGSVDADHSFVPTVSFLQPVGWAYANSSTHGNGANATFVASQWKQQFPSLNRLEATKDGLTLMHDQIYYVRLTCWNAF
jgi:hypothetical protein